MPGLEVVCPRCRNGALQYDHVCPSSSTQKSGDLVAGFALSLLYKERSCFENTVDDVSSWKYEKIKAFHLVKCNFYFPGMILAINLLFRVLFQNFYKTVQQKQNSV